VGDTWIWVDEPFLSTDIFSGDSESDSDENNDKASSEAEDNREGEADDAENEENENEVVESKVTVQYVQGVNRMPGEWIDD
jgi:hypothetical protein